MSVTKPEAALRLWSLRAILWCASSPTFVGVFYYNLFSVLYPSARGGWGAPPYPLDPFQEGGWGLRGFPKFGDSPDFRGFGVLNPRDPPYPPHVLVSFPRIGGEALWGPPQRVLGEHPNCGGFGLFLGCCPKRPSPKTHNDFPPCPLVTSQDGC